MYPPAEALEAGFVDELVEHGHGLEKGLETARQLAKLPRSAYAKTKLQLRGDALQVMADDLGL